MNSNSMSWSQRRKLIYGLGALLVAVVIIGLPSFYFLYTPPTCFDGVLNQGEQGVDCGGPCQKLCASAFIPPVVAWVRLEKLTDGFYNAAAYIVNQNVDGAADAAPYHIALYDSAGSFITDTTGTVSIPPHRNTLAFLSGISVGKRIPTRALFEFTAVPNWTKRADTLAPLIIGDKNYSEDQSGSSLAVTLTNRAAVPLGALNVDAILYDKDNNVLGFSLTQIDGITAGGTAVAPFSWSENRQGKVISIEVLPSAK
jgi:hypothetical protein